MDASDLCAPFYPQAKDRGSQTNEQIFAAYFLFIHSVYQIIVFFLSIIYLR